MGQELLDIKGYSKNNGRIYYLAKASNGAISLRGSCRDVYTHAVVWTNEEQSNNGLVYATYNGREELATRTYRSFINRQKKNPDNVWWATKSWEVVQLQKISAKEYRQIKKEQKKIGQQLKEKENANA